MEGQSEGGWKDKVREDGRTKWGRMEGQSEGGWKDKVGEDGRTK